VREGRGGRRGKVNTCRSLTRTIGLDKKNGASKSNYSDRESREEEIDDHNKPVTEKEQWSEGTGNEENNRNGEKMYPEDTKVSQRVIRRVSHVCILREKKGKK